MPGSTLLRLRFPMFVRPRVEASHAERALLRRQLTEWIRSHAKSSDLPILRKDQLAAARVAFTGQHMYNMYNMYNECRRAAGLTAQSVQRGRPTIKRAGN